MAFPSLHRQGDAGSFIAGTAGAILVTVIGPGLARYAFRSALNSYSKTSRIASQSPSCLAVGMSAGSTIKAPCSRITSMAALTTSSNGSESSLARQ